MKTAIITRYAGQPGKPISASQQQGYRLRQFHPASFRVPDMLSGKGSHWLKLGNDNLGLHTLRCDTEYLACAELLRRAGLTAAAETLVKKSDKPKGSIVNVHPIRYDMTRDDFRPTCVSYRIVSYYISCATYDTPAFSRPKYVRILEGSVLTKVYDEQLKKATEL